MKELILDVILAIFGIVTVAWFAFWILLAVLGTADILTRRRSRR